VQLAGLIGALTFGLVCGSVASRARVRLRTSVLATGTCLLAVGLIGASAFALVDSMRFSAGDWLVSAFADGELLLVPVATILGAVLGWTCFVPLRPTRAHGSDRARLAVAEECVALERRRRVDETRAAIAAADVLLQPNRTIDDVAPMDFAIASSRPSALRSREVFLGVRARTTSRSCVTAAHGR